MTRRGAAAALVPVIDMHAHFVPPDIVRAAERGEDWYGITFGKTEAGRMFSAAGGRQMALPWQLPLETAEERTGVMSGLNVDVQMVSLSPTMHWYSADPQSAPGFAAAANDALAEMVELRPDRYLGLGYLPLQNVPASLVELERCVGELGFPGVMVGTNIAGRDWDDPELFPVLERAADLGCFVFFHPARGRAEDWLTRYHLRNLIGNPLETTAAAAALIFGGVVERLPGLRACLAHGGGYCCGNVGRWDHGWRVRKECQAQISRLPSDYLRQFHFDSLTHSDLALRALIDLVGEQQVLLGSDYPADMAAPDPVGAVLGNPHLSVREKRAILGLNMSRLISPEALRGLSTTAAGILKEKIA